MKGDKNEKLKSRSKVLDGGEDLEKAEGGTASRMPPKFSLVASTKREPTGVVQRKEDDSLVTLDDSDFGASVLRFLDDKSNDKTRWQGIQEVAAKILELEDIEVRVRSLAIYVRQTGINQILTNSKSLRDKAWVVKEAPYKFGAESLEERDQGHSLDRHGPDVSDFHLQRRLTTGIAPDNKLSPAPGLSTKFIDYETWMETRRASVIALEEAIGESVDYLLPYVEEYDKARKDFDDPMANGREKGAGGRLRIALDQAKGNVEGQVYYLNSLSPSPDMVQLRFQPNAQNAFDSVLIREKYTVIAQHTKKIGEGFQGENEKNGQPNIFDGTSRVESLTQTRTGLETTRAIGLFENGGNPPDIGAWKAYQHFPSKEVEIGIRP